MKMERIDKILARNGYGTRKDVKKILHTGTVCINGIVCTTPDTHINTETDVLTLDGVGIDIKEQCYLMLNKPVNCVCSEKDGEHTTIYDLIDDKYKHTFSGGKLHSIGRLDIDTEGLLILTTDGALTHRLTSPKTHVGKTYYVTLRDCVDDDKKATYISNFEQGMEIPPDGDEAGFIAQKAELVWDEESTNKCYLTISEGKYHQVKRMFLVLGNKVTGLNRISIGKLKLDETLLPGTYRELTEEELAIL